MINKIQIENFKSIRNLNLPLNQINILIGANGAGKSNFISFFKLLDNLYHQNFQNYIAENAGAENILYFGLKHSDYLSSQIEFDEINRYYFRLRPNNAGELYFATEGTQFYHGYPDWDNIDLGNGHFESKLKNQNQKSGRYSYVNDYMKSFKVFHFHDTSNTAKIKQRCNIDDNEYLRNDAGNLAAFLFLLKEKHPDEFVKIESAIRSVAPFFDCFQLKPDRIKEDQIRLEWKERKSDMYLNAMHLSDGTLRFMALASLLLQPNIPKTIIIDEPELGLHPFAVTKLAGIIQQASAQSQIIISTQSANFIDNFEPENIITVDRRDHQSVFNPQNSENLKDWMLEYGIGELWNKNVIGGRP
jgi:predicted ATPase